VRNLQLPAGFRKDLRSGLTNRLLLRVELLADFRVVDTRTIELAVKYDLWDENFRLTLDTGQGGVTESVLATEQQVMAFFSDVRLPGLFEAARLPRTQDHVLKGDVLLNPIEKERMAMIRKWVSENSTQTPEGGNPSGSAPVGAATSGDLFSRIFDQYASGAGDVAAWHESLQSKAFRPEAVPNEGK
jgi:hypothetical protein